MFSQTYEAKLHQDTCGIFKQALKGFLLWDVSLIFGISSHINITNSRRFITSYQSKQNPDHLKPKWPVGTLRDQL